MSDDLLRRMRRGDKAALKTLLDAHGGALFALWRSLDPGGERGDLAELGAALWRASATAGRGRDPRAEALVAGAVHLGAAPRPEAPHPEVDLPLFVDAVAREALGVGSELEAELVARALEDEPALRAEKARVEAALDVARTVPEGAPSPFAGVWSALEPRLT